MYIKKVPPSVRPVLRKRGMFGLGDFTDSDQCSTIPLGDPYRKPGNYCATPDGGITTFNADGTTYRQPGYTVDPDPAHPAGTGPGGSSSGASGGGGALDAFLRALVPSAMPPTGVVMPAPSSGISTGTAVALAGGALLLVLVLSRR